MNGNIPHKVYLDAGRSTQATLLGRNQKTLEELFISQSLAKKQGIIAN